MNVVPFPPAPDRDPAEEEKAFFRSRLEAERAALAMAEDEVAAFLHRRLIVRYETVLKLYEESEAELKRGAARRR